jgi:hypothetical protein
MLRVLPQIGRSGTVEDFLTNPVLHVRPGLLGRKGATGADLPRRIGVNNLGWVWAGLARHRAGLASRERPRDQ